MTEQFVLLVAGVLLTGGVGGFFAHYFQTRAWANQRETANRDLERSHAGSFYEELSSRLDRRLYRMKRLNWALRGVDGVEGRDRLESAVDAYDAVLAEWNESINSTFARCEIFFGVRVRSLLEDSVYEEFAAAGRVLDIAIGRVRAASGEPVAWPRLDTRLRRLGSAVYGMNLALLAHLRDNSIGRAAIAYETPDLPKLGRPFAEVGDDGANVDYVQRKLVESGEKLLVVDGIFGLETWLAITRFQGEHGLRRDGVVSDQTLRLLNSNV